MFPSFMNWKIVQSFFPWLSTFFQIFIGCTKDTVQNWGKSFHSINKLVVIEEKLRQIEIHPEN